MPAAVYAIKAGSWVNYIPPRVEVPDFVPGVSVPYFRYGSSIEDSETNVGCRAARKGDVTLTTYAGALTSGVYRITTDQTNKIINGVVDLRNGARLINCRIIVPPTYVQADSIRACVRILLGGATSTGSAIINCEIINRSQRPLNGISGRNTEIFETVIIDCLDGFNDSTAGDAPQDYGLRVYDSVATDLAWWYTPTVNSIIHPNDTISHNDAFQKGTLLESRLSNVTLEGYLSPRIGTGTPGSGSNAGNGYVPEAGYNFIQAQSVMEGWRASRVGPFPTPAESRYGDPQLYALTGGSAVGLMINRDNLYADKIHFGGGTQGAIDATDTNLPSSMNVHITNSDFANDMKNPDPNRGTTKGRAALIRTPKTFGTWSGNTWLDGTTANVTSY